MPEISGDAGLRAFLGHIEAPPSGSEKGYVQTNWRRWCEKKVCAGTAGQSDAGRVYVIRPGKHGNLAEGAKNPDFRKGGVLGVGESPAARRGMTDLNGGPDQE